jgi:hypothetical protein
VLVSDSTTGLAWLDFQHEGLRFAMCKNGSYQGFFAAGLKSPVFLLMLHFTG